MGRATGPTHKSLAKRIRRAAALDMNGIPLLIPNVTDVAATPFADVPRSTISGELGLAWDVGERNSDPARKYWMRIAALRPFSTNPQRSDNWDVIPLVEFNAVSQPSDRLRRVRPLDD